MSDDKDKNPEKDNVFRFGSLDGGKSGPTAPPAEDGIPEFSYVVTDIDHNDFYADGFLIFTPHHLAIMSEIDGRGAVPVLVLPINRVIAAELVEDEEETPSLFDGA